MSDINSNPIYIRFLEWLDENVAADAEGNRKVSVEQLRAFADEFVYNPEDPSTVEVEGADVSLLWSFQIGGASTNNLSLDLAERSKGSGRVVRFIGNTDAGKFFSHLYETEEGNALLSFVPTDPVPSPDGSATIEDEAFSEFWRKLSRFYVDNTDGTLVTLTPRGGIGTVFAEDEIPRIVENSEIDLINGVARSDIGIEVFSSGSRAQLYYLLAVINGHFAGDLLRSGTARVVKTVGNDGKEIFHLDIDQKTLEFLGIEGGPLSLLSNPDDIAGPVAVREELLPAHLRGLQVALFGAVMQGDPTKFEDFVGRDLRVEQLSNERGFKPPSVELVELQDSLIAFVNKIWSDIRETAEAAGPGSPEESLEADIGSLLKIFAQVKLEEDEDIVAVAKYFSDLVQQINPFLDDAPDELKRDLISAADQISRAGQQMIAGISPEIQRRLTVTSGGRSLDLLEDWQAKSINNSHAFDSLIESGPSPNRISQNTSALLLIWRSWVPSS
ncbi:MAG: hypothetical protein AAFQ34_11835, partial [Pseudomonadota bacterium]